MILWLGFFICTGIILYAGTKLSYYGDVIAEKTGLGRAWIGLVLLSFATSLPEMVNSISSVTYAQVPDIAAGDLIGSCVFNLLIIALLDLLYQQLPICTAAKPSHIISCSIGILQVSFVIISIFLQNIMPKLGWIGLNSIIVVGIYIFAMKFIYGYEKKLAPTVNEHIKEESYADVTLKKAIILFSVNALLVTGAAIFLPKIGEGIAELTGLGKTFVGNILIAFSTSLPEIVVSVSALIKCKSVDLALGNLLGSTMINMAILGFVDFLYLKGPLLSMVSQNHIISALSTIIMTSIIIIGLFYRAEKKRLFLSVEAILILLVYVLNVYLLYLKK